MAKRKVDGCKTTIKRGSGCFLIQTKLQLNDNEIEITENSISALPIEVRRELYSYIRTKGECLVSKKVGGKFDNNRVTEKYVAIETVVRIKDYNLRLSIVNNQQKHIAKVKNVLNWYVNSYIGHKVYKANVSACLT